MQLDVDGLIWVGEQVRKLNSRTRRLICNCSAGRGRRTAGIAVPLLRPMRAVCWTLICPVQRRKKTWVSGGGRWRLGFGHCCMRLRQSKRDQHRIGGALRRLREPRDACNACVHLATPACASRRLHAPRDACMRLDHLILCGDQRYGMPPSLRLRLTQLRRSSTCRWSNPLQLPTLPTISRMRTSGGRHSSA